MGYMSTSGNAAINQMAGLNAGKANSNPMVNTPYGVGAPAGYNDPNSSNYIDPTKYNVSQTLQNMVGGNISLQQAEYANTASPLQSLQAQQLNNANQFAQNLPQLQQQTAQQLTAASNQTMQAQLGQQKNINNARGLTYSGINQGQQQQIRSNAQQNLAGSITSSNANLQNASNTLNAQAVETGVGIQQTQQAIQNQIYQQQMANMQANNQIFGSVLGTGILAATVLSDERMKKEIVPISKEDLKEMRQHLKAYLFKYKSEEKGNWIGVMAQDLEKSKLGKTLIFEDSSGVKNIDIKKVVSLFLATLAEG